MTREEIKQMVNTCDSYYSCGCCPYNPEDISRFIGDRWKGGCPNYDRKLVYAMGKGYGDVSEYEAEIERLRTTLGQCNAELNSELGSLKSQCREIGELKAQIKQAKIEILSKLKERIKTAIDTYFNLDGGGYYLAENAIDDIDDLIEEIGGTNNDH